MFTRNREKIDEAKLKTFKVLAYAIAHEMRTPLASIGIGASNLRKFLPIYQDAYQKAKLAGLEVSKINSQQSSHLQDLPVTMEKVSYNAQNIINMLLMKIKEVKNPELEQRSMQKCITSALEQYPLAIEDRQKIHWDQNQDFLFLGKEEMFLHIFFNLLKNSLYQISLVPHGAINIWCSIGQEYNYVHFKDNGQGIPKKILNKIFERFVTDNEQGTGMGLAFCKMAMLSFGGNIQCVSEQGQGAEFILYFPQIRSN